MITRYILEGTWSGHTESQKRVVHRSVHPIKCKLLRAWVERARHIIFSDNTLLILSIRECKPHERVDTLRSYNELITDCYIHNVNSVDRLADAEEEIRLDALSSTNHRSIK